MVQTKFARLLWYVAIGASVAVVFTLIVGAGWYRFGSSSLGSSVQAPRTTYLSPELMVRFAYPVAWQAVAGYQDSEGLPLRFEGVDGFWQLAPVGGDKALLTQAASLFTQEQGKPFGDDPRITTVEVAHQPAALITPRQGGVREAALVVEYPKPIEIGSVPYRFVALKVDTAHVLALGRSLQFFANTTGEVTDLPNILVYSPFSGSHTVGNISVRGVARTFESGVNAGLYSSAGQELAMAFTTAHAPDAGTYGPFHLELPQPKVPAGTPLVLKVFQASAKDGTPIDVVSIPLVAD